jgi:hypothetical protein
VVLVEGLRSIGLLLAMRALVTLAVGFLVETQFLPSVECEVAGITIHFCYGPTTAPWMPDSCDSIGAFLRRFFLRLETIPFKMVSIMEISGPVAQKGRALIS